MSTYAVVDPVSGETVRRYPTISDAELRAAIGRADAAHRAWALSSTVEQRAALVRRVGRLHLEQRERLAEIIVREMGKPVTQALGEVDFAAAIYEFYADNAEGLMADEEIQPLDGNGVAIVRRASLGALLGRRGSGGGPLRRQRRRGAVRASCRRDLTPGTPTPS